MYFVMLVKSIKRNLVERINHEKIIIDNAFSDYFTISCEEEGYLTEVRRFGDSSFTLIKPLTSQFVLPLLHHHVSLVDFELVTEHKSLKALVPDKMELFNYFIDLMNKNGSDFYRIYQNIQFEYGTCQFTVTRNYLVFSNKQQYDFFIDLMNTIYQD